MNSFHQILVVFVTVQCLQIVMPKPIFKGLSLKKNYEVEISAIPFKHISFIKEKWFPFKMIGMKHDIEKREVDPALDNGYSVNEVTFDNDEPGNFPGLYTNVKQNLDTNSEGELIQNPAPVIENAESINIKPVITPNNLAGSIVQASSVIPLNPSIIIAPSIQTMGSVVKPAAIVPISPEVIVSSVPTEISVKPLPPPPLEETKPIQPMYTHVDVAPIDKLEESVSKLHTDISSVVPLNTLVAGPIHETSLPFPVETVNVESPIEGPKVVEEIKVEAPIETPIVEPPAVITSVVEPPIVTPVEEPLPGPPGKTGPPGLLMRGTRFVLYFGSVMLQLLSQMLSGSSPSLNQLAGTLTLN